MGLHVLSICRPTLYHLRNPTHKLRQISQQLFYANGTVYNQTLILNDRLEVDPARVAEQGLPYYAGTWVAHLLCSNIALAATFTHLLLWNRDDIRAAWGWMNKDSMKKMIAEADWRIWKEVKQEVPPDADIDPHYREMLKVCCSFIAHPGGIHDGSVSGCPEHVVQWHDCAHDRWRVSDQSNARFDAAMVCPGLRIKKGLLG